MKKIQQLNLKEWFNDLSLILIGFIGGTVFVLLSIIFYLNKQLPFLLLRAILFIYVLSIVLVALRLYFVNIIKKLGKKLNFKFITPFYLQPRIEGTYKKNWWQIHFVSKETGKDPGILRTYVKLQFKQKRKFDENKLKKYRNYLLRKKRIIIVKHIIRPNKNYLLIKRDWFTFNKNEIIELMDLLLKISKESELK